LINEVKHWGEYHETNSFDLHRKRDICADGRRANAIQPQKGPAKDDDIFRVPKRESGPADAAAAHVFTCALSPADVFNGTVSRADVQDNEDATTDE
jgi:hypothetical protein